MRCANCNDSQMKIEANRRPLMSNCISSASGRKNEIKQLYNKTQRNEKHQIKWRQYQRCDRSNTHQNHKICKDNRENLNKRLLPESYFIRNIFDLSAIMAVGNLKPNISWHSVTVWISLVLDNLKNRLTEKSNVYRTLTTSVTEHSAIFFWPKILTQV